MKITHIIGIVAIALGIFIVISTAGNASSYVNFSQAYQMASEGDDAKVHLMGELKKDAAGNPTGIIYDPQIDPNYLQFELIDENKESHAVVCTNPPASMQDFFRSEKVVVIGRVNQGQFVANEVLMKCPSKYEESELN
jgi:cytochrome c-type biogenesis protein CcmE